MFTIIVLRTIVLILLFFSLAHALMSCSSEPPSLSRFCPVECFHERVEAHQEGVGICQSGTPVCDEDNVLIECLGAQYRQREICDGLDNDCDGVTDEDLGSVFAKLMEPDKNPCDKSRGVCADARAKCEGGEWQCVYPDDTELGEEVSCDNKDNDCDGIIDENIGNQEFCYDGEFWQATNGQCRPGVIRCVVGEMQCDGQVLPSLELCDEIDNDCDGVIDEPDDVVSEYDIVFAIDHSGSMCGEISAVATALEQYVQQFEGNENFKFAIVLMTGEYGSLDVVIDFSDVSVVSNELSMMANAGLCNGSGSEGSLDILHELCMCSDGGSGLSWRNSAQGIVFSFTDEPPQSYRSPSVGPDDVISACLSHNVIPYQWSLSPEFYPIIDNAGGKNFVLFDDWEIIFSNLNEIVLTWCE